MSLLALVLVVAEAVAVVVQDFQPQAVAEAVEAPAEAVVAVSLRLAF